MAITDEQLINWFTYHPPVDPNSDANKSYAAIREAGLAMSKIVRDYTPSSADQTAAIRHIRDAVMTANSAVACGGK